MAFLDKPICSGIANAENIGNLARSICSLGRHISFSCVIGNATHISSLPCIFDTPCGTSKSLYNAGVSATTNMRRNRRSPALRCERIHSAALLTGSCHSYARPSHLHGWTGLRCPPYTSWRNGLHPSFRIFCRSK